MRVLDAGGGGTLRSLDTEALLARLAPVHGQADGAGLSCVATFRAAITDSANYWCSPGVEAVLRYWLDGVHDGRGNPVWMEAWVVIEAVEGRQVAMRSLPATVEVPVFHPLTGTP